MQGIMWIIFLFLLGILGGLIVHLWRKNYKKFSAVLIVVMILCFVIFFGIPGENRYYLYTYSLKITPTDYSDYRIYLPLPVDEAGEVHEIFDDKKVEAEYATVEVIETSRGMVLSIVGAREVEVHADMEEGKTTFFGDLLEYAEPFGLSLMIGSTNSTNSHEVFINLSNRFSVSIELHVKIETGKSNGIIVTMPWVEEITRKTSDIEVSLTDDGWQSVGSREATVTFNE
jgi:hypothetical protein